jgi:hypothetical protein
MEYFKKCLPLLGLMLATQLLTAQNPLITNQFTADPSARVFGDRVYVYPSHDILATPGHGRVGWFCMEDYHVFSSANLTDWKDHGVILSQAKVPWADSAAYSMWAPDCINRNGKYYFYFPTIAKSGINGKGFTVGVAIADYPTGPFNPQREPIKGVHGIDPNVFIDHDGQAYLYWAQGNIFAAKLKANMLELDSEPVILASFPEKGLKEGPYLFERKGIYYMTYPHVANKTERLEYTMSNSPLGPFTFAGVIMDESASGCWTNHQSIVRFKNQWYLFYHNDDLSPKFDKNRSIRADSLFFNADGTIKKVIPTLRGVGITPATKDIQIDRYSAISPSGAAIDFVDTLNRMKGWKAIFNQQNAWVRYNKVDFGKSPLKTLIVKNLSIDGSTMEIHADQLNGPLIAKINLGKASNWTYTRTIISKSPVGVHDLFIVVTNANPAEVDWIRFE